MSRLMRASGLRFCQLRLLSSRAKKTRPISATPSVGEPGLQKTRDQDDSSELLEC